MNILSQLLMLFEDKADYVAKTFDKKLVDAARADDSFKDGKKKDLEAADVVKELVKIDPKQKHIVWIARLYSAKSFKLEDSQRISGELDKFEKFKKKLEKKDLNAYKSLSELYSALEKIDPEAEEAAAAAAKALADAEKEKSSDATWIVRTKDYMALIPKSKEASCKYGAGTKWCTAATQGYNHYESYSKRGDLVIIMAKIDGKQRKFQWQFETDSFMDERDVRASKADVSALCKLEGHIKLIDYLIDKHHPE